MKLYPNSIGTITTKKIGNKPYYYLSRRIKTGKKYKKILIYLGKQVPNDLRRYLKLLRDKELVLAAEIAEGLMSPDTHISAKEYTGLQRSRISLEYALALLSESKREQWWRTFAVSFIFESNAIEGSRLSQKEVESIILNKYVKQKLARNEVREVENAIEAFGLIRNKSFKLTERDIIRLHALVTRELGVLEGFKKHEIIVNNKVTTTPGKIRKEMSLLLRWWKRNRTTIHPFFAALIFHQRFERIHPFEDGNGRVGRLILIWMLIRAGYGVVLFRNQNRRSYFAALADADDGRPRPWFRFGMKTYRETVRDLLSRAL